MNEASLPSAWFDDLYAGDADPWRFASSAYERAKYAATLQALPALHVSDALEIGCSIGVLTRMLARRCDRLLAIDPAEAALVQARRHCADLQHVTIERRRVPEQWPHRRFDLILLSEVLYYLAPDDVARTARLARDSLQPGGTVLLVHYTGPTDYPCSGDRACEIFIGESRLAAIRQRRETAYRLDLLRF